VIVAKEKLHGAYRYARNDIFPILKSTVILRALFGIFTVAFSEGAVEALVQYIHKRFKWSYEDVCTSHVVPSGFSNSKVGSSGLSFQALCHIIALCSAMPLLLRLLVRCLHDPEHANLFLIRICAGFHMLDTVFMGLSASPSAIFAGMLVWTSHDLKADGA